VWNARHTPGRVRSLVGLQDPAEHRERRKAWTRAFSSAAVKGYEEIVAYRVNQLAVELEKHAASKSGVVEPVDMANWLSRFS
jgi:cytochrome P450